MTLRCPRCRGHCRREPASVTCSTCGWWTPILDATDEQRSLQRMIDHERRPRSVECTPPFNDSADGWWPTRLRLPGAPVKRKRR